MPRRGFVPRREVAPDPIYRSTLLQRLINKVMERGKKSKAEKIVYGALQIIHDRTKRNPLEVLAEAIKNCTPLVETRPRRVGGATYQVPIEVRPSRRISLALRWIVQAAREREDKTMAHRLAVELMEASQGRGGAVRMKEEMHRIAEANRAFAHYRW
ncbi:MAG: 30S ribosomal protein S7 [Armatimonadetes bacterium]|nr:30S ribosomal protein S7 [Armatimonadota bacterium]MCX7967349.1 30S ribosomal protein S7 [Armatimonadota bacterium]MDW8144155.1 30S ribosomal protein S7 [Armatimonadota bacterium]